MEGSSSIDVAAPVGVTAAVVVVVVGKRPKGCTRNTLSDGGSKGGGGEGWQQRQPRSSCSALEATALSRMFERLLALKLLAPSVVVERRSGEEEMVCVVPRPVCHSDAAFVALAAAAEAAAAASIASASTSAIPPSSSSSASAAGCGCCGGGGGGGDGGCSVAVEGGPAAAAPTSSPLHHLLAATAALHRPAWLKCVRLG